MDWTDSSTFHIMILPLLDTGPNTCLGSEEQLRPGQAPGVVPTSVLLLAHDGRCPQALGPEQGPWASGSSGSLPCRDRKGVRKPGENATALYSVLWLWSWRGDYPSRGGGVAGGDQRRKLREDSEEREAGRATLGACNEAEMTWQGDCISHLKLKPDTTTEISVLNGSTPRSSTPFSLQRSFQMNSPSLGAGVCH